MALDPKQIALSGTPAEKLALFQFDKTTEDDILLKKFKLFARSCYPHYFTHKSPEHHDTRILNYIQSYRGRTNGIEIAYRGDAKRQPLDEKILTPNGWVTMGDLSVGDYVIGSDGKPTEVVFMSEIVDRPVYKVQTADGREAECDGEHLWTVRHMNSVRNKYVTLDVNTILEKGLYYQRFDKRYNKHGKEYKFAIDTVESIEFDKKDLPIDPYTLGVIIGDGHCARNGTTRIFLHSDDESHYRQHISQCGEHTGTDSRNKNVKRITITGVSQHIKALGLNVNCYDKFIPEMYLWGSIEQRKSLLQGLMDTDGTPQNVKKENRKSKTQSFSTVSEKLADDVVTLVRSLGGRAVKRRKENEYAGYYMVSMTFRDFIPFRLERKKLLCKTGGQTYSCITNIELVGNKLGRCIKVANKDGLYVTRDYLLTHNTSHLKLFITFVIVNDKDYSRRYIKILSRDLKNAVQFTTDIYNNIVSVRHIYGDIFENNTDLKREERMSGFTTKDGVKLLAGTVGQTQRGHLQDGYRPDWVLFEDIEDRESVSSIAITEGIIRRCDEAITGLSFDGNYHVNGNYISDAGVIQWFLNKPKILTHKVPIVNHLNEPYWDRYTPEILEKLKGETDDWAGEYLVDPTRAGDKFFDIALVKRALEEATDPVSKVGYVRRWANYNPHHRYGIGVDLSDGVGKDSCALTMFDFKSGELVATADENEVGPDLFTHEAVTLGAEFGNCIIAPETNNTCGGIAVSVLKERQYPNVYQKEVKDTVGNSISKILGWHTNAKTKPEMFYDFRRDFNDGLIKVKDERLLKEMLAFTKSDLQNAKVGAVTRHFDILTSACIAWQMKDSAGGNESVRDFYASLRGNKRLAAT